MTRADDLRQAAREEGSQTSTASTMRNLAEMWDDGRLVDDDPGYRDFPYENSGDPAFCDTYEPHQPHTYLALNSNTYSCPGLSAKNLAAMEEEANRPPCEHGLSQALCAGPGHYPMDEEYR